MENVDAIVVRMIDYKDNDRIIGLLTAQHGKISAYAAGAKKSARRFGGGLDLFAYLRADVTPPKRSSDSLWHLSQIHLTDPHLGIRQDLKKFASAGYVSECIWIMATEGEPQPVLFDWWRNTLQKISSGDSSLASDPRVDLELLTVFGFTPRFSDCSSCHATLDSEKAFFSYEKGGLLCGTCKKTGQGLWMNPAVAQDLTQRKPLSEQNRRIVRSALEHYLVYVLGKEPRSLKFRKDVLDGDEEAKV